jgi:hypothetical protein
MHVDGTYAATPRRPAAAPYMKTVPHDICGYGLSSSVVLRDIVFIVIERLKLLM